MSANKNLLVDDFNDKCEVYLEKYISMLLTSSDALSACISEIQINFIWFTFKYICIGVLMK